MHHNAEYYSSPDHFRPERWLVEDPDVDLSEAFMAFGIGARACIGRK